MNFEKPSQSYLDAVKALTEHDIDQLDARLKPWLSWDGRVGRLQKIERAALQLQLEEESLVQWRANLAQLRASASR